MSAHNVAHGLVEGVNGIAAVAVEYSKASAWSERPGKLDKHAKRILEMGKHAIAQHPIKGVGMKRQKAGISKHTGRRM